MKHAIYRSIMLAASLAASCVYASAKNDNPRIMKIGDTGISKEEFEYYYDKNSNLSKDRPTPEEYVDMFANFKLKVLEAKEKGYDTVQAYQNEIAGYRKQLAAPYLTDDSLKNALIEEEYARLKENVRVSHIMLRIIDGDTATAYAKGKDIVDMLDKGEDFARLAKEFSDDIRTKSRGGDMGFISGMTLLYPLEDAAYKCPVGKHSGLIRTPYGYHIIKVTDRRPDKGEILTAHILISKPGGADSTTVEKLRSLTDSLYSELEKGADFAQMAAKYSQDGSNAGKGGELPWITVGRTNVYFDDAAFALENPGDLSKPVETNYGWHIIKLIGRRDLPVLDGNMRSSIESMVMRDQRRALIAGSFIAKLKDYYGFKEGKGETIATFADQKLTKEGLEQFCKEHPGIKDSVNAYINFSLTEYEDANLENKYKDFAYLMQEYRDGILLFNISNDSVWQKAGKDTTGLEAYYEAHKEDYAWELPRFKGRIIYCKTPEIRKQAEELAATLPADSVSVVLKLTFNAGGKGDIQVLKAKTYIKGNDPVADYYAFKQGKKPVIKGFEDAFAIGKIMEQPESYKDVKGSVINDYQKDLERKWIENLRKKYEIRVYQKVLDSIE